MFLIEIDDTLWSLLALITLKSSHSFNISTPEENMYALIVKTAYSLRNFCEGYFGFLFGEGQVFQQVSEMRAQYSALKHTPYFLFMFSSSLVLSGMLQDCLFFKASYNYKWLLLTSTVVVKTCCWLIWWT